MDTPRATAPVASLASHAQGGKGIMHRGKHAGRQKRGANKQPVARMKHLVEALLAELGEVMEGGIAGQDKTPRYAMLFGQKEDVLSTLVRLAAVYEKLHKMENATAMPEATMQADNVALSDEDWAILSDYIGRQGK